MFRTNFHQTIQYRFRGPRLTPSTIRSYCSPFSPSYCPWSSFIDLSVESSFSHRLPKLKIIKNFILFSFFYEGQLWLMLLQHMSKILASLKDLVLLLIPRMHRLFHQLGQIQLVQGACSICIYIEGNFKKIYYFTIYLRCG